MNGLASCLLLMMFISRVDSECTNQTKADIYFLADASGSIAPVGWNRSLNFICNLTNGFILGPDAVQFGFGIFSTEFVHQFDLDKYTDRKKLCEAVLSTVQLKGLTYTDMAISEIDNEGYVTKTVHGARTHVPKYLIIITDGESRDMNKSVAAADALRAQGVEIICIGVGVINKAELRAIAGSDSNVYSVRNFAALSDIQQQIAKRFCEEITTTTPLNSPPTTPLTTPVATPVTTPETSPETTPLTKPETTPLTPLKTKPLTTLPTTALTTSPTTLPTAAGTIISAETTKRKPSRTTGC